MLNYGLIYGLVLIITSVVIYAMNLHYDRIGAFTGLAILVISILLFPILGSCKIQKRQHEHYVLGSSCQNRNGNYHSWDFNQHCI